MRQIKFKEDSLLKFFPKLGKKANENCKKYLRIGRTRGTFPLSWLADPAGTREQCDSV